MRIYLKYLLILFMHSMFVVNNYDAEADFLCTKMSEKINGKMEHRVIKEQYPVLLASIEVSLLKLLGQFNTQQQYCMLLVSVK